MICATRCPTTLRLGHIQKLLSIYLPRVSPYQAQRITQKIITEGPRTLTSARSLPQRNPYTNLISCQALPQALVRHPPNSRQEPSLSFIYSNKNNSIHQSPPSLEVILAEPKSDSVEFIPFRDQAALPKHHDSSTV